MKKMFFSVLLILAIGVSYLVYNEYSFSPLKERDFQNLFMGNKVTFDKSCSKDFLGIGLHGELFEIYRYKMTGVIIDKSFPKITEWEHKEIVENVIVEKWKSCPIDSQAIELYKFTLKVNDFDKESCFSSFNKEILNPKNYYTYVHFNDLEQYFLLYCTNSQDLYYLRKRGF